MYCAKCGSENEEGVKFCAKCGASLSKGEPVVEAVAADSRVEASIETHETPQGTSVTTINVQAPQAQKNPLGVAGFIFALLGVFLSWVPILGWVIWFLGALFSIIGSFKKPKGMAVAGVILTFINLILLLFVIASCSADVGGGMLASL